MNTEVKFIACIGNYNFIRICSSQSEITMAFAVSCALKEEFCDCLSIVCAVALVLPDEHETSAFPLVSPSHLTSSGYMEVSRDGFRRRETYQKRFFSHNLLRIPFFFFLSSCFCYLEGAFFWLYLKCNLTSCF